MSTQFREPTLPPRSTKVRTETTYDGTDLQSLYDQIKSLKLTGQVQVDFYNGNEGTVRFIATRKAS